MKRTLGILVALAVGAFALNACVVVDDDYVCDDGQTFFESGDLSCDDVMDCDDLSDELGCYGCGYDEVNCLIGGYDDCGIVCDGYDDCDDGFDEDYCY